MGKRAKYKAETKAAVLSALLTGQSVGEIAKEYDIPASTIRAWKSKSVNGESVVSVPTQKKERIGDLLLVYLDESLTTLSAQQRHFRDPTWLAKQDAADLAVLHGVTTDKAIRLLEQLSPRGENEAN